MKVLKTSYLFQCLAVNVDHMVVHLMANINLPNTFNSPAIRINRMEDLEENMIMIC